MDDKNIKELNKIFKDLNISEDAKNLKDMDLQEIYIILKLIM